MLSLLDRRIIAALLVFAIACFAAKFASGAEALGIFAFVFLLLGSTLIIFKFLVPADDQPFLLRLFILALGVRVMLGIFLLTTPDLIEPDSLGYEDRGWIIAQAWQSSGVRLVPEAGVPYDPGYYYLNGIAYALFGHYPITLVITNAFIGAILATPIYLLGMRIYHSRWIAQVAAVLVAFWPSLIYWTSQNLKESVILILLAIGVFKVGELGFSWNARSVAVLLVVTVVLGLFRLLLAPALLIMLIASLALWLRSRSAWRPLGVLLLASPLLLSLVFWFIFKYQYSFTPGNNPTLESLIAYRNSGARGATALPVIPSSLTGILLYLPMGLLYYLAGPFPWIMPTSFRQWFLLPEMLVWLGLVPFTIIGLWRALQSNSRLGVLVLFYLSISAIGTVMMDANMGTMYRQRLGAWIFCFALAAGGFDWVSCKVRPWVREHVWNLRQV